MEGSAGGRPMQRTRPPRGPPADTYRHYEYPHGNVDRGSSYADCGAPRYNESAAFFPREFPARPVQRYQSSGASYSRRFSSREEPMHQNVSSSQPHCGTSSSPYPRRSHRTIISDPEEGSQHRLFIHEVGVGGRLPVGGEEAHCRPEAASQTTRDQADVDWQRAERFCDPRSAEAVTRNAPTIYEHMFSVGRCADWKHRQRSGRFSGDRRYMQISDRSMSQPRDASLPDGRPSETRAAEQQRVVVTSRASELQDVPAYRRSDSYLSSSRSRYREGETFIPENHTRPRSHSRYPSDGAACGAAESHGEAWSRGSRGGMPSYRHSRYSRGRSADCFTQSSRPPKHYLSVPPRTDDHRFPYEDRTYPSYREPTPYARHGMENADVPTSYHRHPPEEPPFVRSRRPGDGASSAVQAKAVSQTTRPVDETLSKSSSGQVPAAGSSKDSPAQQTTTSGPTSGDTTTDGSKPLKKGGSNSAVPRASGKAKIVKPSYLSKKRKPQVQKRAQAPVKKDLRKASAPRTKAAPPARPPPASTVSAVSRVDANAGLETNNNREKDAGGSIMPMGKFVPASRELPRNDEDMEVEEASDDVTRLDTGTTNPPEKSFEVHIIAATENDASDVPVVTIASSEVDAAEAQTLGVQEGHVDIDTSDNSGQVDARDQANLEDTSAEEDGIDILEIDDDDLLLEALRSTPPPDDDPTSQEGSVSGKEEGRGDSPQDAVSKTTVTPTRSSSPERCERAEASKPEFVMARPPSSTLPAKVAKKSNFPFSKSSRARVLPETLGQEELPSVLHGEKTNLEEPQEEPSIRKEKPMKNQNLLMEPLTSTPQFALQLSGVSENLRSIDALGTEETCASCQQHRLHIASEESASSSHSNQPRRFRRNAAVKAAPKRKVTERYEDQADSLPTPLQSQRFAAPHSTAVDSLVRKAPNFPPPKVTPASPRFVSSWRQGAASSVDSSNSGAAEAPEIQTTRDSSGSKSSLATAKPPCPYAEGTTRAPATSQRGAFLLDGAKSPLQPLSSDSSYNSMPGTPRGTLSPVSTHTAGQVVGASPRKGESTVGSPARVPSAATSDHLNRKEKLRLIFRSKTGQSLVDSPADGHVETPVDSSLHRSDHGGPQGAESDDDNAIAPVSKTVTLGHGADSEECATLPFPDILGQCLRGHHGERSREQRLVELRVARRRMADRIDHIDEEIARLDSPRECPADVYPRVKRQNAGVPSDSLWVDVTSPRRQKGAMMPACSPEEAASIECQQFRQESEYGLPEEEFMEYDEVLSSADHHEDARDCSIENEDRAPVATLQVSQSNGGYYRNEPGGNSALLDGAESKYSEEPFTAISASRESHFPSSSMGGGGLGSSASSKQSRSPIAFGNDQSRMPQHPEAGQYHRRRRLPGGRGSHPKSRGRDGFKGQWNRSVEWKPTEVTHAPPKTIVMEEERLLMELTETPSSHSQPHKYQSLLHG